MVSAKNELIYSKLMDMVMSKVIYFVLKAYESEEM